MAQSPASSVPVAVIGAGPYGLSIAAHLRERGISYRIFGKPMDSWRMHMPQGMFLKSEGFASDLYDCERRFTLKEFCKQQGYPYQDVGWPVPLDVMVAYALSFQEKFVPDVEQRMITALDHAGNGFRLQVEDGEVFKASRVIVAAGTSHFQYVPAQFIDLPPDFLSHSYEHRDLSRFKGRDVTVIGGGASALDLAALLDEAGAQVRMIVRQQGIRFLTPTGGPRSLASRVRSPLTPIGGGWRSLFFTSAPMLFHYLPEQTRLSAMHGIYKGSKFFAGPAAGWWVKERIQKNVSVSLACICEKAQVRHGRVHLQIASSDGGRSEVSTDHVIAATGFRVDLRRLRFLCEQVRSQVRTLQGAPVLSANFESSVPGLYFVGLASTNDFGPTMRFMCGAGYTAKRMSEHLARVARTEIHAA